VKPVIAADVADVLQQLAGDDDSAGQVPAANEQVANKW
jgi:hypothetical protein